MSNIWNFEWRLLARDRLIVVTFLVMAISLIYASSSGERYRLQWQETAASIEQASRAKLDGQIADLRTDKPTDPAQSSASGTPRSVVIAAPAAVPPLAHFSVGQSDLYPRSADAGIANRIDNLFKQYQIQSPLTLASGRFDLAYVVIAVLPLLAIVLCFDLVAADRAAGRLALLVVQAGGLGGLIARRLLLRGAVLMVPLLGLFLWGFYSGAPLLPLLLWILLAVLYAAFWLLLCACVALRPARPETQAAQLVALWLLLVLALPAGINRAVDILVPPPSQQAFQATLRAAEISANRKAEALLQGYLSDHPELTVDGPEAYAAWMKQSYVVARAVEAETRPVLEAHEARIEQAHRAAQWLQFLSPAAATQVALSDAAGTGPEQQATYVAAVRAYKINLQEQLAPALYRGVKLSADELAALPAFQAPRWTPAYRGLLLAGGIGFLTVLCLLLALGLRRAAASLSPLST
jgi:ABC-2 type transport system permease protein